MKTNPLRKKTKVQRTREYALQIFAYSCKDLIEVIKRLPDRPTRQRIKEMLNARFDVAADAAEVFDTRWESVKGRFQEEEEE
jgi:hypothetical protein